uniref:GATA-type domain-containing protein n=1 Tax=Panagrolaimus davidi TaxID=227884 RepID=A0A914PT18_9BILA
MNQDKLLLSLNLPSSSHISSIASANNSTDCSAKSNQAGALEREIPISWESLNDTRSPNKSPDILCHVTVGSHIDPFKHSTLNQSPNPLCIPPFMGGTKVFATGCSAIRCGTATASIIANNETAPITSGERTIHLPLFTACKLYDDTKLFEKPKPLLFTDGIQGKAKVMPKATAESATISSNPQNSSCSKCKTLKTSKWYNFKNDELFCNLCWHFGDIKNGELDKKIPTSNGILIGVESVQESLPVIFSSTSLKKFKSDSSTENSEIVEKYLKAEDDGLEQEDEAKAEEKVEKEKCDYNRPYIYF